MSYFDNYLVPVKKDNKENYLKHLKKVEAIFKEYGAKHTVEFWSDDIPDGEVTSFTKALKLEADEAIVVGFISWGSKADRDKA